MSVKREYKALLEQRLNQLWYQSYVVFERWELLTWYSRERVTNVIWRDIQENWDALFSEGAAPEKQKLKVIKCDDSTSPQKYCVVNAGQAVDISKMMA